MKTKELIDRLSLENQDKDHYVNHLGGVIVSFDDMKSNTLPDVPSLRNSKYGINDVIKMTLRIPRYDIRIMYKSLLMVKGHLRYNDNSKNFYINEVMGDKRILRSIENCKCVFQAEDVTDIDYEGRIIYL